MERQKMSAAKKQPHVQRKEQTRSITYRLPAGLVEELETEAAQRRISQNVLVRQIIEGYMQWGRHSDKIGMIPVPKGILRTLGDDMDGQDIDAVIKQIVPMIKDSVLFMKGGYDLRRCVETLEDYMRASGMKSDHRVEGSSHHFIIQHGLGTIWSVFTEQLLTEIFRGFMPDKELRYQSTDSTVILTVDLGSDFSEHDY